MRILILGGDGYLGWPTAMSLAAKGHEVFVIDNYLKRNIARDTASEPLMPNLYLHDRANLFQSLTGKKIKVIIGDCSDVMIMNDTFLKIIPDAVIHYAEQPSAPYSMRGFNEAKLTLRNNLDVTFNLIWAILRFAPNCHLIKLGTMGEYGTPNIDIEEGWLDLIHNGRSDRFLYPRQGGSLYHTTKVLDTDLLWFYVRTYEIRVTDLMQGPVYGLRTEESFDNDLLLPNFHYDDIFGTVVNRFLVQAIAGIPLTIYGQGGQTRGYLNLIDTLKCIELALNNPASKGQLRIFNQFTEQFSVNQLAHKIQNVGNKIGLNVKIANIPNPRKEKENHYYNAKHSALFQLGLLPTLMSDDVIIDMLHKIQTYKSGIDCNKIMPRVDWNS